MIVDRRTFPELRRAFEAIERDNGGHLIGTVYPGEALDLEAFAIPDEWAHLLPPADLALAKLREKSAEDWETFVTGEVSEAEAIFVREGNLAEARTLLNDYFNGWQPEDRPGGAAVRLAGETRP